MASLGELTARAILDIAGFSNPLKKMEKDTQDAAAKVGKHFTDIGKAVGGMVIGLAAGVAGAAAIMQEFSKAIDIADQLNDLSTATGVSVEALDELSGVAKLNNIDITDLTKGFKEMNKSIMESHDPSSKAATIFGAIGINLDKPVRARKVGNEFVG